MVRFLCCLNLPISGVSADAPPPPKKGSDALFSRGLLIIIFSLPIDLIVAGWRTGGSDIPGRCSLACIFMDL